MKAIVSTPVLKLNFPKNIFECEKAASEFQNKSFKGAIGNCVSAVDGYLMRIQVPSKKEVKNVRSYFSGHYKCYGVNIQAACDSECRFQFIAVTGPGVMGDTDAVAQCGLDKILEGLPGMFCAITDAAYTPTEHCIPVFGGAQTLIPDNDNFNFYTSQL